MKPRLHKCGIDGREYWIPESWLVAAIRVRAALGASPNQAFAEAVKAWDKLKLEENKSK